MMLFMTTCKNDKGEPKLANDRTVRPSLYCQDIYLAMTKMSRICSLRNALSMTQGIDFYRYQVSFRLQKGDV